jgi:multidrug efflux pump subunit AcrA (membrane-fusion protein)
MTADVKIQTAFKENSLVIPEKALQEKNGKFIVEIFEEDQIKEREIEIGLRGSGELVEVVSGLKEGEEVIVK